LHREVWRSVPEVAIDSGDDAKLYRLVNSNPHF